MAADPQQVMRILDIRGARVHLRNGQLIGRMDDGPMPPDIVEVIRHFKALIVAELQERERLAETVANVLALDDGEYEAWVKEIRSALPDDPHLAHDRRAWSDVRHMKDLARVVTDEELEAA